MPVWLVSDKNFATQSRSQPKGGQELADVRSEGRHDGRAVVGEPPGAVPLLERLHRFLVLVLG